MSDLTSLLQRILLAVILINIEIIQIIKYNDLSKYYYIIKIEQCSLMIKEQ